MQFSAATIFALVAAVTANTANNVVYTTITNSEFVTICPASSTLVHLGQTYTNTLTVATTITIACPSGCAQAIPIYTTSSVICNTCPPAATPVYPSKNATIPGTQVPSAAKTVPAKTNIYQGGAEKIAALSGAGLAGLLGLVAYVL